MGIWQLRSHGAGIGGIVQHAVEHLIGRTHPDDLPGLGTGLDEPRQFQAIRQELALDRAGIAQDAKALEDGGDRQPHRLVGIEHHAALGRAPEADGQRHGQRSATRLVDEAATHARLEDVQLGGK
jgi:hypothetical protein